MTVRVAETLDDLLIDPPVRIRPGVMAQRWDRLSFLHWRFEPGLVRRLLPDGLAVDEHDGSAWVGVVPFRLTVGLPGIPPVPWASRFPEVNVRTYVRGPDGRRGIWFLSLDAARLGAVVVARTTYRLPYLWARMRMSREGREWRYSGARRWPGPGARFDIRVRVGDPISAPSALERFLTCRWRLYSPRHLELPAARIGLDVTTVDHPPWPLRAAEALHVEESLLRAAGLPPPDHRPIALASRGVAVRFGRRRAATEPESVVTAGIGARRRAGPFGTGEG